MAVPPIRSILAATDLSARSDSAVRGAAAIAALTDAELHILHAFDFQRLPYPGIGDVPASALAARVARAEHAVDEQIRRALPPAATVASREVVIYVAHRAILDRAEEVGADLIVLGPHRGDRVADRFLGTTADRVIRTADVPCLIIPDALTLPLGTVIAPVDFSEAARDALAYAIAWTAALGHAAESDRTTELKVLHVIPRASPAELPTVDEDAVLEELGQEVEQASASVDRAGEVAPVMEIRWAERPADEIIAYARRASADLIVLGTHGHGPVTRALIGSVASAVAREAPCPVLLVPPAASLDRR